MRSFLVVFFAFIVSLPFFLTAVEPCYYYGEELYCLQLKKGIVALDDEEYLKFSKSGLGKDQQVRHYVEGVHTVDLSKLPAGISASKKMKSIRKLPVVSVKGGPDLPLTGEIGVVFRKDVTDSSINEVMRKFSLKVSRTIEGYWGYFIFKTASEDPFAVSRKIHETGLVKWAQPVWLEMPVLTSVPNDTFYPDQWQHKVVNSEAAWDLAKGRSDVLIAVVDSGVDTVHFDLQLVPGMSFVPSEQSVDPNMGAFQNQYMMAHGTAVSGIAAARGDNGFGVAGVCQQCSVIPVKYIGLESSYPPLDRKFNAIKWAVDAGAWVINNSWSIATDKDSQDNCIEVPLDNFVKQMIDYAVEYGRNGLGTVIVWAAGNSTCDTALNPSLNDDRIVVVSALANDSSLVYYSNYGDNIDISSPAGESIPEKSGLVTTDSTLNGKGFNPAYNNADNAYSDYQDQAFTKYFDGTSAAAPVVAGAIALTMSTRNGMTYSEAIDCMKAAASVPEAECSYGAKARCFGAGILNAGKMVEMAVSGECGGEPLSEDEPDETVDDQQDDVTETPDESSDNTVQEVDKIPDDHDIADDNGNLNDELSVTDAEPESFQEEETGCSAILF